MNIEPIWSTAITLMAPFVKKAGEEIASKVGESLYNALKKRFGQDKDRQGKALLKSYHSDPEIFDAALSKYLERCANKEEFYRWLADEVQKANNTAVQGQAVTQKTEVHQNITHANHSRVIGVIEGDYTEGGKP